MSLHEVLVRIEQADDGEICEIIRAVIGRYRACFPEWEIIFLSLPKGTGRAQALEDTISFLRQNG